MAILSRQHIQCGWILMSSSCDLGGCIGSVWIDQVPVLDTARVRPFAIPPLLLRGAITVSEFIGAVSLFCNENELKEDAFCPIEQDYLPISRLEHLVLQVLGEMTASGLLSYDNKNEKWDLTDNDLASVISWCSATGGRMPQHLLAKKRYGKTN